MIEPLRNKGYVIRTNNGYIGRMNIEDVAFDINVSFWNKKINGCDIWIQRVKAKRFNENTNTFSEYTPYPFFDCKANKTKKNDVVKYRGAFMFVGFKYELAAWFEDKTEHQMNFEVERSQSQPILKRLNEINKEQIGL